MQPTRRPPAQFRASGFAVANGQHVLTNIHVIPEMPDTQQKESLAVFTGRGQRFEGRTATAVAMDREYDLALLKIEGNPLPVLGIDLTTYQF